MFGHHYAHLQENKTYVTACGVLRWFCWMWLVAVVGRCLVGASENWGASTVKLKSSKPFFKDETEIPKIPRNTNTVIYSITHGVVVVVILLRLQNM